MADPTKYTKAYSFEGYQANNPSKPLPAPRLDDELEKVALSIDETIDALKDVRRSDGTSVVRVGTAPISASAVGTAGELAYDSGFVYVCVASNTWKRAALAGW